MNGGGVFLQPDSEEVVYSVPSRIEGDGTISTITGTMGVPNLEVMYETIFEWYPVGPPIGNWDDYVVSKLYEGLDVSVDGVEIVGSNGNSDRASGWYFFDPTEEACIHVWLGPTIYWGGVWLNIRTRFYDQFLVIDGQMITFLEDEFRGKRNTDYRKEPITMPDGKPGIVYTLEMKRLFYGRNFYAAAIDTVYQTK